MLKHKLQQSQQALNELTIERDNLKDVNKKLDSENSILMQETVRLKMVINEKNSQMSNKYTMAAMETKLESYERARRKNKPEPKRKPEHRKYQRLCQ